jgi:hypothetical protein
MRHYDTMPHLYFNYTEFLEPSQTITKKVFPVAVLFPLNEYKR